MGRPQKYQTEVDRQAARRLSDAARKRRKRAVDSAAKNALKKDPTKRKDAAVNAGYPVAPINDDTLEMIKAILEVAGDLSWAGGAMRARTRDIEKACIALMQEWEAENHLQLPSLEDTGESVLWNYIAEGSNGPVNFSYTLTFGERWNKFHSTLRLLAFFDERNGKNNRKKQRHAETEKNEAVAAGLTVAKLRDRKDAVAKQKWEDKTQTAFHRAKSEEALAKHTARIERESTDRMERQETFGRF
ncbi:hypothetical protein [Agrobacterium sp. CG674]